MAPSRRRPSIAGAQLSKSSCGRSRTSRKPNARELTRGPLCWRSGQRKTNSAESSCGSASDSRRPLVKVGGPRSYGWRDMPNKILIPLQSLVSCFLELHPPTPPPPPQTGGWQWVQLRDSGEATLWYVPKALSAGPPVAVTQAGGGSSVHNLLLCQGSGQ